MKAYSGFEAKKNSTREVLPAGGYVAKILNAKEQNYDWGNVLVISFDIVEGEHQSFFTNDYQAQTGEDKKWRGTYRLNVPKDDGSEKDQWTKNTFGGAMWAIQESNPGYHWDWDESKLKDKTVGVLFRNREWEMNGNTGWTTECCAFTSASDIRENKFKMPKDKPLKKKSEQPGVFEAAANDNDLPWL